MMNRRIFLCGLTLGTLSTPLGAEAQPADKMPRIGVLSPATAETEVHLAEAFREGLRSLGYVEGQNVVIKWRYGNGRADSLGELAAQLVRLRVDVILAVSGSAAVAAQRATKTIPVVMLLAVDPVGVGLIESLGRPGGNITGLSSQIPDLAGKRLQLFREAVPNISQMAVVWDPTLPGGRQLIRETEVAARALGVQIRVLETLSASDIDRAFAAMARDGTRAALIVGSPMQFVHRGRIAELAEENRLPTICALREFVEAGCLMTYGPSFREQWSRGAYFVDKILKGAKPADLPVEQPTKFELVINLKTARALGLNIPQSLLLRADELIE